MKLAVKTGKLWAGLGLVMAFGFVGSTVAQTGAQGVAQTASQLLESRIDEVRKAPLTLSVVDEAGEALEGATLSIKMRKHAFEFGTAVNATFFTAPVSARVSVYGVADATWSETDLTWDTRPALGEELTTLTLEGGGDRWHKLDLSDYVTQALAAGKKTLSVGLRQDGPTDLRVDFLTKETDAGPELVIENASGRVVLTPSEDIQVRSEAPTRNFQDDAKLKLINLPEDEREGFLTFDLSSLDGLGDAAAGNEKLSATLRLYGGYGGEAADVARYHELIPELFNAAVLENEHKWSFFERPFTRERADATTTWLIGRGLKVRGHAMLWQTLKYGVPMPPDVAERVENDPDAAYFTRRADEHIRAIGAHYAGQISEWDVVNEQISEHELTKTINPDATPETAPVLVDWFKAAAETLPTAELYVNDYGILVGNDETHKNAYERLVQFLLDEGAPLSGIGFQGHVYRESVRRTPEQLTETLDRFAVFGLPLKVTEFDMFGDGWGETQEDIEAAQAEYLEMFLSTMFAHPAVEGVYFWGFWDGRHWADSGAFYRQDWTPKPALDVYRELIFEDWWTDAEGSSDAAGKWTERVFKGSYEITVDHCGHRERLEAEVGPEGLELEVVLPPCN